MAKWGNCDFKQLQQLRDNLDRLQSVDLEQFCMAASKELAARLLALVIPRTPVGDYGKQLVRDADGKVVTYKSGKNKGQPKKQTVKKGGTLRRGWTAKTSEEAAGGRGNGSNAEKQASYADTLPITRQGTNYIIEVINPVEYASYVEFGHRTRGGGGWVKGQYFLTISEQELERMAPVILERKLDALLREVFNV